MNKIIAIILGFPKSIYLCLKSMPLREAIHVPIFVSANTKLVSIKGKIKIDSPLLHPGMVRIGLGGSGIVRYVPAAIENNDLMIWGGHVNLCGCKFTLLINKVDLLLERMCL